MYGDISCLCWQWESWKVETLRSEQRDVRSMGSWYYPEFTIFAGGTGNRDPDGEAATTPAMTTQRTVLVPADIRHALDDSHLFQ